jgi:hypothetical protein
MTYRRKHRWLRRLALGLAFATFAAPAAAKPDEGSNGVRYVTAGGWSGYVDSETGVPVSAGIPQGDEPLIDESTQVIPYLSHGIVTEADQAAAAAEAIHDPFLTDVFVRPGESLGGPDGGPQASQSVVGEAVKSRQGEPQLLNQRQLETLAAENGATAATRPDDRADRFTGIEQPQVISYLSHGLAAGGEVGARPDDQADRFAHSDVASEPDLAGTGSTLESRDWFMTLGIGAIVLAVALGLGLGFVKRPKLAGV